MEAALRKDFLLSDGSSESGESGGFAGSGKVSGEKSVVASGEEGEAAA